MKKFIKKVFEKFNEIVLITIFCFLLEFIFLNFNLILVCYYGLYKVVSYF